MHDIRPYLPELFNNPGSLLYIGARADAHNWLEELLKAGNDVDILEVWPDNIDGLVSKFSGDPLVEKMVIISGNVQEWVNGESTANYDYFFWWHGPEHLDQTEIVPTIEKLESKCRRTIAMACPWGSYPQGAHEGNPYEEHKTTLYPWFFRGLGYEVATDGEPDKAGSEIVAWKRMSP